MLEMYFIKISDTSDISDISNTSSISLISVITITYNRGQYLKEAIESVLEQNFRDFELLVIDDASIDDTENIVKEYVSRDPRVKYFRNEKNLGIAKSRNIALNMAQGKYVAVLDSDDVWSDFGKLKKQYNFLEQNLDGGYVLAGGGVAVINEKGREIERYLEPLADKEIRRVILLENPFAHSTVLFLKEAALKCGGYDENLKIGEDYDLWLKMGRRGKFVNLADYLIRYRLHSGNICGFASLLGAKLTKQIIQRYRNDYPNYKKALIKAHLRIIRAFFRNLLDRII